MPDFSERLNDLKKKTLGPGETLVICHHCGCPWISSSIYEMVSCPSCGGKTPRVKEESK